MRILGATLACDTAGRVQRVLADGLGVAEALPRGAHWTDLVDAGSVAKADAFDHALRTEEAAYAWEINVDLRGNVVPVHADGCSSPGGVVIVLRTSPAEGVAADYTTLDELSRVNNAFVSLQRDLAKKNASLQRSLESERQLMFMAAHDLRNPLAVIRACGEVLAGHLRVAFTEPSQELLQQIFASSGAMAHILEKLLRSKLLEVDTPAHLAPTDLQALVRANVAMNRLLAARKNIGIEIAAPETLPLVAADAGKIDQVLNNLIDNAVKYSPSGTTVTVRLAARSGGVDIAVTDQGLGIPADEIGGLFQPFARASTRPTAGEPSIGLGLAIVKRLVEGHGGAVRVRSEAGRGTTFLVSLPELRASQSPGRKVTAPKADRCPSHQP